MHVTDQWLAGFFDGEGCLSPDYGSGRVPQARVQITQKSRTVLDCIAEYLGYGTVYRIRTTDVHVLSIRSRLRVAAFLDLIEPYILVKREQVALVREMLASDSRERRIEIGDALRIRIPNGRAKRP